MSFWKGKKVAVSGAYGFLGPYLCDSLLQQEARLVDLPDAQVFFNLAAHTSGIGSQRHRESFAKNVLISTELLDRASRYDIETIVVVSSACIYPESSVPLRESIGGRPVEASAGYGYAKLVSEMHASLLHSLGSRVVIARAFNAYGPGDKSNHVIPDLMKKIQRSGPVQVWGGNQIRSFTYATDWVDALMFLAEHGPSGQPVNLAGDEVGVRIDFLAEKLIKLMNSDSKIEYAQGPIGHSMRIPDLTWLHSHGWKPKISLDEGLKRTVEWYETSRSLS
jgi:GDP-L-fucose synthase